MRMQLTPIIFFAALCVLHAASLPTFTNYFFTSPVEVAMGTEPGNGTVYWDPQNLRARSDLLFENQITTVLVFCDKSSDTMETYIIFHSVTANWTMCSRESVQSCNVSSFDGYVGFAPELSLIAGGVGVNMHWNGTDTDPAQCSS
eukprot:EC713516.1.p1 GENE.EC713516.1~~EC713516.1.p1  ORF type:complete len:145 (+),score=2.29 EC713516.1:44-478(+)